MDKKRIVIVGAGYAGILTAKKLAKKFKKNSDVTITVIDKNPFHVMLTELHEVAAYRVEEESIRISLKKVFAGRKIDLILDTITSFDFDKKLAIGKAATYEYDYLILSAGSKPTYFGTPGAEENAFTLWSYDDAVAIRHHLLEVFRKAASETDPVERHKLLSFYVVGAGFTGVEMVGELAEYAPVLCEKFGIEREEVTIGIIDILERACPNLNEPLSAKISKRLHKMGVQVMLKTGVVAVGKDYVETKQGDVTTQHPAYTVIWGAGVESAEITAEAGKTLESAARGRIKVDAYLRSVDKPSVYVIGDNMLYTPEGEDRPVPQIVENAEHSAETAAHNLECELTGHGEMKQYKPVFHGFMVCVGGRYGVARVGVQPKFMINLPSFLAMFSKHFINVVYFIQVLGWNKVWSYAKHEFFTIRNDRSFLGGHFSNKTPSFLLVPLRIWLGGVWLFEGIMKIVEGWFNEPKLESFFGSANAWYDAIVNGTAGVVTDGTSASTQEAAGNVADAATGATGAAEGAGQAVEAFGTTIMNWDFLGLFRAIFVSGKELVESTFSDLAFKLDVPLINWMTDTFIIPNTGVQVFMQSAIVIAEILIGLALIGGLFTFPASALSLILQFMFITTTGLYLGTMWMVVAAIAILIGGGRTFGLDYYAVPVIKSWWKKLPWVRKLYIYND